MSLRMTRTGRVKAASLAPFTPEGERAWVDGWSPAYPAGVAALRPGLVFEAAGAVWVVTDVEPDRLRYARVTPGARAGLVEVRRRDATSVEVTYDLTALTPDAAGALRAFADGFDAMLGGWQRAIERHRQDPPSPTMGALPG